LEHLSERSNGLIIGLMRFVYWYYGGWFLAIVALGIMSCVSCAHRLENLPDNISPSTLDSYLHKNISSLQQLEGRANFIIESPEYSNRGVSTIYLQYPDSLLIQIRGPFGLRIATIFITSQSFLFYDHRENAKYDGPFKPETIKKLLGINLDFREIIDFFTGIPVISEPVSQWKIFPEEGYFLLCFTKNQFRKECIINRSGLFIHRIALMNSEERLQFEKKFREFRFIDGLYLPKIIEYIKPDERRAVVLVYRSRKINKPLKDSVFHITVPSNAKEIIL